MHQCAAPDECGALQPNRCGCAEWTAAEVGQLCQDRCAYEPKCSSNGEVLGCVDPGSSPPAPVAGSCTPFDGPYSYCDSTLWFPGDDPPTFECGGCERLALQGADPECTLNSARPFRYACGPERTNGIQDPDETDVDCGGRAVVKCGVGQACQSDSDCRLQTCLNGTCANAARPPVGCEILQFSGTICCPEGVGGWRREPGADGSCPSGSVAFMDGGEVPAGCTGSPGFACCSSIFP